MAIPMETMVRGFQMLGVCIMLLLAVQPKSYSGSRRSTEGAEGANKGNNKAEGMAIVGVHLAAQLG